MEVTAERLQHWANEFARMKDAKQVVPMNWDHANTAEALQPLSLADYEKKRSAKDTVGHVVDMKATADGAELTLDIADSTAAAKAETNLIYVSPVVFPSWKDGAGNEYSDVLTHCDLVNHPVDHSQGPFIAAEGVLACGIRMGLDAPAFLRMGDEDDDDPPKEKAAEGKPDAMPSQPQDDGTLADVIATLAKFNIILSDKTNTVNFLTHLHQALLTAAAHQGDEDPSGDDKMSDKSQVADPGMAALSLEDRGLIERSKRKHKEEVAARLKSHLEKGKCTPAEFKEREPLVSAIRLSLDSEGNEVPSRLEDWLDSRESVPDHTFWSDEQRVQYQRMSVTEVATAPSGFTNGMTDEEADQLSEWAVTGKRPAGA